MSVLDKAVTELEAKRSKENAERKTRHLAACAFLKEFYESDVAPARQLKAHGVRAAFDGARKKELISEIIAQHFDL